MRSAGVTIRRRASGAVVRVLEGRLKLTWLDPPSDMVLEQGSSGLLLPQQDHFVEPLGPMKMRVDFYDTPPIARDGARQGA